MYATGFRWFQSLPALVFCMLIWPIAPGFSPWYPHPTALIHWRLSIEAHQVNKKENHPVTNPNSLLPAIDFLGLNISKHPYKVLEKRDINFNTEMLDISNWLDLLIFFCRGLRIFASLDMALWKATRWDCCVSWRISKKKRQFFSSLPSWRSWRFLRFNGLSCTERKEQGFQFLPMSVIFCGRSVHNWDTPPLWLDFVCWPKTTRPILMWSSPSRTVGQLAES